MMGCSVGWLLTRPSTYGGNEPSKRGYNRARAMVT